MRTIGSASACSCDNLLLGCAPNQKQVPNCELAALPCGSNEHPVTTCDALPGAGGAPMGGAGGAPVIGNGGAGGATGGAGGVVVGTGGSPPMICTPGAPVCDG